MTGENPETSEQQERMSSAKKKELERTLEVIGKQLDRSITPLIDGASEKHSKHAQKNKGWLEKAFDATDSNDKKAKSEAELLLHHQALKQYDLATAPPRIDENIKHLIPFKESEVSDLMEQNKKRHFESEKTLHTAKSVIKSDGSSNIPIDASLKSDQSSIAREEKRDYKDELYHPEISDRWQQSNPSDAISSIPRDAGPQSDKSAQAKEERKSYSDVLYHPGISDQLPESKLGDKKESRDKDHAHAVIEYLDELRSLSVLADALPNEGEKSVASNKYTLNLPTFEARDKTINEVSDANYQKIKNLIASEDGLSRIEKKRGGSIFIDPILFLRNPESGELRWVNWRLLSRGTYTLNDNFVRISRHEIEIMPRYVENLSEDANALSLDVFGSQRQDPEFIKKLQDANKLINERIVKNLEKGNSLELARNKAHDEALLDLKLAIWDYVRIVLTARRASDTIKFYNTSP